MLLGISENIISSVKEKGAIFTGGAYRITDDSIVTRTEYDGNGNAVRITDENGNRDY